MASSVPAFRLTLLAVLLFPATVVQADTYVVDRFDDEPTASSCTAAADDCSLRGAVLAANAHAGSDTIEVPSGTFVLTAGAGSGAAQGDLELEEDTILEGAGMELTILEGEQIGDHFFTVETSAEIRDLTLSGAESMDFGGAVEVNFGATALLERVAVLDNSSALGGGGVAAAGDLTVSECRIAGNLAESSGGGIVAALDAKVRRRSCGPRSLGTGARSGPASR